ncbi:uncharacterized protein LOC120124457 [Hibiscus syriacus]|uniref:uncharacterized protein LOC120124457 n=1 Tax=Hibiscus syriacus TaxID=106335 RepID=UPI0019244318|nr:uncharacterized protein LOC120124457 [Hibiscus syriacus]
MNVVASLPLTHSKKDFVWMIVDRLTKSTHFIPVWVNYSLDKLARLYIFEIVRHHDVSLSIIFDQDPSWEDFLPLAEFAYNKSYQASIHIEPYEALYGRHCRTIICWTEFHDRKILGLELVQETKDIVRLICDRLRETFDRQKSYADQRQNDIEFKVRDQVFLKVSSWKKVLRFGRKGHIIQIEEVELRSDLSYEEDLVQILDRMREFFRIGKENFDLRFVVDRYPVFDTSCTIVFFASSQFHRCVILGSVITGV